VNLLRVTRFAVVDAGGRALVQLGPVPPWRRWSVDRVAVSATAGNPEARLYRGEPAAGNLLGGTHTGALDTYDPARPVELFAGQSLTVEWTGGAPGSTATATATGSLASA
jgi:hypothetical protein